MLLRSSKDPCEHLDPWLWVTNLIAGVVERVCFAVAFRTGDILKNFEKL
jgi:hypothetical protein